LLLCGHFCCAVLSAVRFADMNCYLTSECAS
jgi:hypothetical protein